MNEAAPPGVENKRLVITVAIMLATVMYTLDTTIANVALPHMQGSMSAAQDQITWVLTSYVVSSAIFTALTGFFVSRFGRTRLYLVSVLGFTAASMLCGIATSLTEMVAFRLLQGAFGAALVPLSQTVLMDIYPKEKQGPAMAMWAMGVMLGPIIGPTLGGYLTEVYNWRWVFYINLPVGILSAVGLWMYLPETATDRRSHFDLFGFTALAVGLVALQLMLDRGHQLDWFDSREIVIETTVAAVAFYIFLVHMFTAEKPFLSPQPFRDLNYVTGLALIFLVGVVVLATMALLPTMLQNLMGYPVMTAGWILAPRGLGSMVGMALVGRLVGKVDARLLIGAGFAIAAASLWQMASFNLDSSAFSIAMSGVVQGFGIGLVFVPMTTVAFATMAPRYRTESSAVYSLVRNIASSIGISVMITLLARNTQIVHAELVEHVNPFARALQDFAAALPNLAGTPRGYAALAGEIDRQALMVAYLNDFKLMMWLTLAGVPMVLLMRPPRKAAAAPPSEAAAD